MFRFLVLSLAFAAATALDVSIFYESTTEENLEFFTNQFVDAWATYGDDLEVTYVPFGSAWTYEESDNFYCYEGPAQCYLNKVQLCTLSQLATASAQAEYVICANTISEYPGQDCVDAAEVDWATVQACTEEGGDAASLLLQAYADTSALGQTEYPIVVFNGVFDEALSDAAVADLSGTIAGLL